MRALSIVALVSTIGCSVVAAVDPARDAGAAPLPFGTTCQPCVTSSCAATAKACATDPACAPLARCGAALAPNDVAGRGDCEARFASALTLDSYQRLDTCLRQECLDPCLGRRGLLGAYPPACRDCYEQPQRCGDQIAACVRDGACERAYRYCFGAMSPIDPSRVAECFFAPASALGVADDLASCLGSCPQACPIRKDWSCVGRYDWPDGGEPTLRRLRSPVRLFGFGGTSSGAGVQVEVCTPVKTPCLTISSSFVDENSIVELMVPDTGSRAFRGYFRLTGRAGGTDILPEYLFLGLPIYRDLFGLGVLVFARAETNTIAEVAAQAELDPERGHIAALFLDCTSFVAAGVTLEIDPDSTVMHPTNARLSTRIGYPGTEGMTTGNNGGAAFNVKPGCVEIVGRVGGQVTHRLKVFAEKGTLTYVYPMPLTASGDPAFDCQLGPR